MRMNRTVWMSGLGRGLVRAPRAPRGAELDRHDSAVRRRRLDRAGDERLCGLRGLTGGHRFETRPGEGRAHGRDGHRPFERGQG